MFSRVNIHMIGAFSSAAGLGNPVYVVYDYGKWSFEKDKHSHLSLMFLNVFLLIM